MNNFILKAKDFIIDLTKETKVMGIINVTPDSFYDANVYFQEKVDEDKIISTAQTMIKSGVDIIDIGGESTRPGATPIDAEEEKKRVLSVIAKLSKKISVPISIDTYKKEVAEESIRSGASLVNDISGLLYDEAMAKVCAKYDVPIILMHTKEMPHKMQWSYNDNTIYTDIVLEVKSQLKNSVRIAKKSKVKNICIDPGFGFGKSVEGNFELLKRLKEFQSMNLPIVAGLSRKSFIGKAISNETLIEPKERLYGTIAANSMAILNGANILRVHDVQAAKDAIKILNYLN